MKKITAIILTATALVGALALVPVMEGAVYAAPADEVQRGVTDIGGGGGGDVDLKNAIQTVVNALLFLLSAVAVIMIIIGGIRYTTSNGDSTRTKAAKDTILYAVVGLVVAILAFAIVNWVIGVFQ